MQADINGTTIRELRDTWIAIDVDSNETWTALKSVVGDDHLTDSMFASVDGRIDQRATIDERLSAWAAGQDPDEAAGLLQRAGVNASPVYSPLMLVYDEHLAGRGNFPKYDHPEAGEFGTTKPVWRLTERPFDGIRPGPCFGEHNRDVLSRIGGLSDPEIDELEALGVVATEPV